VITLKDWVNTVNNRMTNPHTFTDELICKACDTKIHPDFMHHSKVCWCCHMAKRNRKRRLLVFGFFAVVGIAMAVYLGSM
jgi:predicted nucleic acid-binding Zn ribbon protein